MKTIEDLFEYFDSMVVAGSDDELFASSYLRDFINLAITELNCEGFLSAHLYDKVSADVKAAKSELTPQDQMIVNQFWQGLAHHFA